MPHPTFDALAQNGHILPASAKNAAALHHAAAPNSVVRRSLDELVERNLWQEFNDRFFKTLAFGTGGLRGRSIGRAVTAAEQGAAPAGARPEFACVGSNAVNDFNIERATRGLCRAVRKSFPGQRPSLVIAHDTRHFSRHFAELAARAAANEGVDAFLFDADRSTPQLSFAVRRLGAAAGVVITASHNPPHDNGFKAYFSDGAQIVEPQASAIIREVEAAPVTGDFTPTHGASVTVLEASADADYAAALDTLVLDRPMLAAQAKSIHVVYTPIHGAGIRAVRPALERLGVRASYVAAQIAPDGAFPTVKSPNPENGEALALGIEEARRAGADAVIGTDPDCDRMGVAVRNAAGGYELLTGNQIGSILAHYRAATLFRQGVLTPANAARACLIKTFVTTELQAAIAAKFGLKLVNTLTGFKYIGEKLLDYERMLLAAEPGLGRYNDLPHDARRDAHLRAGCFFVFGGEESYGYSGGDYVRDKDGNAAVVMFVEALAAARAGGMNLLDYLDAIYAEFGYFTESLGQIVLEGAEGAARIKRMLDAFAADPPAEYLGHRVTRVENFARQEFRDADGKLIPKELMLMVHLGNGARFAVRGSGTEPKVKFYLFGSRLPAPGAKLAPAELAAAKTDVRAFLKELWPAIEADAMRRAG